MKIGVVIVLLSAGALWSQSGIITTIAGGYPLGDGGPAGRAALCTPSALAVDDGNLFILDSWDTRIRRITPDGTITTILGADGPGFAGDGDSARLGRVNFAWGEQYGLAFDRAGNLYISDSWNQRIRRVSKAGIVSTFAGSGEFGAGGDGGPAAQAQFLFPGPLAFDTQGNLYVTDQGNHRVRRIDLNGIITTVAGNGTPGYSGDLGPATEAQLNKPGGIAVDAQGYLYIADRNNNRVRRVDPNGFITTFIGPNDKGFPSPIPRPDGGLAVDAQSNLYVNAGNRVYRLSPSGNLETFAGNGRNGWAGDGGPALAAPLRGGQGIAIDRAGNLYRADNSGMIRRIDTAGNIQTIAGVGSVWGDGGPAVLAWTGRASEIAADPDGNIYTNGYNLIRRIAPDGKIHIHANDPDGCTQVPATGSLPARAACVGDGGLTADPAGNLFVYNIDTDNRFRVTKVDRDARASIAPGSRSDQVQVQFGYRMTNAMAVDAGENLYLTDSMNHRILKVTPEGEVSIFAGTGAAGFSGDGGPAASAQLNGPSRLAADAAGNVYIADSGNRRIRLVDPNGVISTFAGTGRCCFNGDGLPATQAQLDDGVGAVAADLAGNVYFVSGARIRKVTPRGIITTVAGNGQRGNSGDGGPATQASFQNANSLTVDGRGNLYFTDNNSYRIRRVQGSVPFAASPSSLVFSYSLGAPPAQRALSISVPERESRPFTVAVSVTGSVGWLTAAPAGGATNAAGDATLTVTANPTGRPKGIYTGRIDIANAATGEQISVPVTMIVSGSPQQLRLSQTGFLFSAVEGGSAPPAQTLGVVNAGAGAMNWTVSTSVLSGAVRWLAAAPVSGASVAGAAAPAVETRVNPAGLAPGVYYGLVTVAAPGVDNSPQSAVVLLAVLPKDKPPGPVVDPNGMIFTGSPGGGAPPAQSIRLANVTNTDLNFSAEVNFPDGKFWFWPSVKGGTLRAGQTLAYEINPYPLRGLSQGVYRADVTFRFWPVNATLRVSLALVVAPGAGAASKPAARAAETGCVATKLVPVFRSPGDSFWANAGWPLSLQIEVVDDCGRPLNSGQVVVSFSNNDPPVALTPVGAGRWSGAWASRSVRATNLEIAAKAASFDPVLAGEARLKGSLAENADQPMITPGGVLNGANYRAAAPLAPGSFTVIFGSRMAKAAAASDETPWPIELSGTSVMVAGRPMPLQFVSDTQINGVLPFGLAENTQHQLIVRKGLSYSLPETVLVAASEPEVFSVDGSGKGPAKVYMATDEGLRLPDAGWPARAGDTLVVFATGLGSVLPGVGDGAAGPQDPPAFAAARVRATLQDKEAEVIFAGLAPGAVGVYRVELIVPAGLKTDASAPLVIRVGEESASVPVTVMVKGEEEAIE